MIDRIVAVSGMRSPMLLYTVEDYERDRRLSEFRGDLQQHLFWFGDLKYRAVFPDVFE